MVVYMEATTAQKFTATSAYGKVIEVTIDDRGYVKATNGAFLGEYRDMQRIGWEFTR